jgi:hypothetical protein
VTFFIVIEYHLNYSVITVFSTIIIDYIYYVIQTVPAVSFLCGMMAVLEKACYDFSRFAFY